MHTIELAQTSTGWMARYTDPEILRLFGTDTLLTGFGRHSPADGVVAEMTRLNPESKVFIQKNF